MSLIKTFSKYLTGSALTLVVGTIATPILTRLISTEEMGKYAMYLTTGSLFSSILYLGLDQSYVRYFNEEKTELRTSLLKRCLHYPLLATLAVSILLVLLYVPASNIIIGQKSFTLVIVFVLYLFSLITDRFWLMKIRMKQKAFAYSLLNFLRKLSYLIIALILYYTWFGNSCWTLILALSLAEFILLSGAWLVDRDNTAFVSTTSLQTSMSQLTKYGLPFIFSTTITLIFHSTDQLMLKALSSYSEMGLYSGAQNIVNLITQVQVVFSTFWVPVAFEHFAKQPEDKKFYIKVNKIVSYVMLLVLLLLLSTKDIVVLFLGENYREAVYIFPFLAFMPILYTVSETTVLGINFMKKTQYHVAISLICAIVNLLGNYFLIRLYGAKGAAISTGLSYVVFFGLRTYFANKVFKVDYAWKRFAIACFAVYLTAVYASFNMVDFRFVILTLSVALLVTIIYKDIASYCVGRVYTYLHNTYIGKVNS